MIDKDVQPKEGSRLNVNVRCEWCSMRVNPWVIKVHELTIECECPTCGDPIEVGHEQ